MKLDTEGAMRAVLSSTEDRELPNGLRDGARALAQRHFGGGAGPRALLDTGDTVGRYRVVRVIGVGGQAAVYQAKDPSAPRDPDVAIKVPHGQSSRRMLDEARALARLRHPRILRLFDVVPDVKPPHMIIEHCEGGSLADRIAEGPLPEGEAWRIADQILDGLGYAHDQGVVHRDLKPQNLLFDQNGDLRIADFGIGKVVAEDVSNSLTGAAHTLGVGTPLYFAPEQERRGAAIDGRTDLYALGKILYEMLTGIAPRTIRPLERDRQGLDPAWEDLIFRLTEVDPGQRCSTAAEARSLLPAGNSIEPRYPSPSAEGDSPSFEGVSERLADTLLVRIPQRIAESCEVGGLALAAGAFLVSLSGAPGSWPYVVFLALISIGMLVTMEARRHGRPDREVGWLRAMMRLVPPLLLLIASARGGAQPWLAVAGLIVFIYQLGRVLGGLWGVVIACVLLSLGVGSALMFSRGPERSSSGPRAVSSRMSPPGLRAVSSPQPAGSGEWSPKVVRRPEADPPGFKIMVQRTATQPEAERLRERLEAEGLPVIVESRQGHYSVLVGTYTSQDSELRRHVALLRGLAYVGAPFTGELYLVHDGKLSVR